MSNLLGRFMRVACVCVCVCVCYKYACPVGCNTTSSLEVLRPSASSASSISCALEQGLRVVLLCMLCWPPNLCCYLDSMVIWTSFVWFWNSNVCLWNLRPTCAQNSLVGGSVRMASQEVLRPSASSPSWHNCTLARVLTRITRVFT